MNMEVDSGSVKLSLSNEHIKDALILSLEPQKPNEHYLTNTKRQGSSSSVSSEVLIIAFKGSLEVKDWYHDDHFGETDVDQSFFPSLKRIGEDRPAKVNKAILQKFQDLLNNTGFKDEGSSSSVSSEVLIIAFKGSLEVKDWYHDDHFGETDVDQSFFPSLKRIGEDRPAKVNKAILQKFQDLLNNTGFKDEVEKAVKVDKKKILFTGHLYGGALACFATLWMLETYIRKQKFTFPIGCVTFGSPLIGNETLSHAVRREKWSGHFTHFVMEHDMVPRIMLAPKTSIQEHLHKILQHFQKNVNRTTQKPSKIARLFSRTKLEQTTDIDQLVKPDEAAAFFESVLINASSVASHDAYDLMEPTSTLKEKLSIDYVKISPYRPFGEYVFCTCDETQDPDAPRQQLIVENPDAVLQLLFCFMQLPNENQDINEFARNSLAESFGYEDELNKNGLQLQKMVKLKELNEKLWTSNHTTDDMVRKSNKALFELTADAKWCLMAAEESEKRKKENEKIIDTHMRKNHTKKNKDDKSIEDFLDEIRKYKNNPTNGKIDYYDAFFGQDQQADFLANVNRLELAKIWDVIVEMVIRKDLPDEFEGRDEWVALGTEFRRLVEVLDIANYYRHSKGEGSKPYLSVRPKRYKFTQRWLEHAKVMPFELVSESNFVSEIEELIIEVETRKKKTIAEVMTEMQLISEKVQKWRSEINDNDVFWGESVFSKLQHTSLTKHINSQLNKLSDFSECFSDKMDVDSGDSVKLSLSNELNTDALSLSLEAQNQNEPYLTLLSSEVFIIALKGSCDDKEWCHDDCFGETDVDPVFFPSLKRIGEDRPAKVNKAILQKFKDLLNSTGFKDEVKKAVVVDKKKILFTGHLYGGALASFATLWMLDEYKRKQKLIFPIGCVTFGSPLIGDETLSHAVRREKWSGHFTHFVMEHDIVPRIMLAPKKSIQGHLPKFLKSLEKYANPTTQILTMFGNFLAKFLKRKTPGQTIDNDQVEQHNEAVAFFENVLINASTVASHDAHDLMEPTSTLIEKLSVDYMKVSPYRPFGDYVFCTCDNTQGPDAPRQQLIVENPNAVLQLLCCFLQLPNENQEEFVVNSLAESLGYEEELNKNGFQLQNMVKLKELNGKLWTSNGTTDDVVRTSNKALFELDYYDAFFGQDVQDDFLANVNRLEQAKIWEVIMEMVTRKDLPDEFEGRDEWVALGTEFRRLVEVLDIANYYRHSKGEGSKPYMSVRPKRYKFTQRWHEHANVMPFESVSESTFVAEIEELIIEVETRKKKTIVEVMTEMRLINEKVQKWRSEIKDNDVFWGESVLSKLLEKLA
ncbi:alpha/Beta hydrolase fold protein [Artemisia annua]|uniref:Alpha/Beta hydrolase fold protein n=1 Tax=Artemisia annua TaxID=35608 RepID=A0A2U1LVS1_ARTAN|nr:alpha/Beta hydrolase fold protein [Artemisia annua]